MKPSCHYRRSFSGKPPEVDGLDGPSDPAGCVTASLESVLQRPSKPSEEREGTRHRRNVSMRFGRFFNTARRRRRLDVLLVISGVVLLIKEVKLPNCVRPEGFICWISQWLLSAIDFNS